MESLGWESCHHRQAPRVDTQRRVVKSPWSSWTVSRNTVVGTLEEGTTNNVTG